MSPVPVRTFEIQAIPFQLALIASSARLIGAPAGLGAGKTDGIAMWLLDRACANSQVPGQELHSIWGQPTAPMLKSNSLVALERVCERDWGMKKGRDFHFHAAKEDYYFRIRFGKDRYHRIYFRAAKNPHSADGINATCVAVDEAGNPAWRDAFHRFRARSNRDRRAVVSQFLASGTPEGRQGPFYEFCESEKHKAAFELIRASTRENVFLDESYADETLGHLNEEELQQYEGGFFVTRGGLVYDRWKPGRNGRAAEDPFDGQLVMGIDFGVRRSAWLFGAIYYRGEKEVLHVFDELIPARTGTYAVLEQVREKWLEVAAERSNPETWAEVAARIDGFCDATAHQRSDRNTVSRGLADEDRADDEDRERAKELHGIHLIHDDANPSVHDRVHAVNDKLRRGELFVDVDRCPELVRSLEGQGYDKRGDPEKARHDDGSGSPGLDHAVDALGYIVWQRWPVARPAGNIETRPNR